MMNDYVREQAAKLPNAYRSLVQPALEWQDPETILHLTSGLETLRRESQENIEFFGDLIKRFDNDADGEVMREDRQPLIQSFREAIPRLQCDIATCDSILKLLYAIRRPGS